MRELARLIEPVERERAVHGAGAGATACIASLTPRSAILQEGDAPGADPLDEWVAALDLTQWEAAACRRALLRVAEQRGRSGSWAWDLGSGRIVWSENMFRILGFAREDGVPSIPEILDRAHPADRAALAAALERAQRHQELPELTYRVHTATGQTRFLHADRALRLPRTGGGVLVGWLRDATEERESERLLALRSAVTAALVCCHSTDGAVRRLLAALGSTLGFGRGALMLPAGGMLHVRAVWAADDANAPDARRSRLRIRRGQGLAGRAWEQAAVLDARELTHGPRMRSVPGSGGIRVALALPIPGDGDALGVIELAGSDDLELTARLRGTLAEVAEEIGTFLGGRMAQLRGSVLSPREIEVLELAAGGLSGPAIAARLHLSPSTVKTHFENVYAKYEVPDRVAAVAKALREGLIR